ncbi:MAG: hypothetical protein ACYC6C_07360 [Coriobacteriia bacterium]
MKTCKFMNVHMQDKVALADILRQRYCLGVDRESCARLAVVHALGAPEFVPIDLWPNDLPGADRAIARSGACV